EPPPLRPRREEELAAPAPGAAKEETSSEDLSGFLDEAGAAPAAKAGEPKKEPPKRGGGFIVEDEDPDEIEAYVPEGAPPAAAAEEKKEPAPAPEPEPEEEEEEGMREVVGVGLSHRLVSGLVDFGILGALQGLFAFVSSKIVAQAAGGAVAANMEALIMVGVLNAAVLFLLSIFYSVYFVGMFGCTPGQRCMGLSVVDMDDKPVEYMQAVLRYFGGLAAALPLGLGYLLVLFDKRRRGLGDRLAGTRVALQARV
ncbi:MAG: RDD family protein, partial [Nitrospinota bacterium]